MGMVGHGGAAGGDAGRLSIYTRRRADALGYERPRAIRQLIERLADNLATLGTAPRRVAPFTTGNAL